ncbi:hypothetical protein [Haladaptatus pallidirubidus]|uniref:hypothetical protein n=1 Tax=Haladaptatus pallidirubidus TaxID=1008152 RepID=UPI00223926E7|nr:hypothetical protein [Haladaptatus pallidirubidus]
MTDHTKSDTSNQHREHADQTTHQFTFDPKTDSVSGTLVSAIATLNNADPSELAILSTLLTQKLLIDSLSPAMTGLSGTPIGKYNSGMKTILFVSRLAVPSSFHILLNPAVTDGDG